MSSDPGDEPRQEPEGPDLEWRDYLALAIAALETILIPLVAFVVILIVLLIFLH